MSALLVIGLILLILVLIGLIPVGTDLFYDADGFRLSLRILFFSIRLGGGNSDNTGKKGSDKQKKASGDKKKNGLPSLPKLKILANKGYAILCRIVRSLRVDILRIHFTSAFADPATTAMVYAAAGTAMEGLLRVGEDLIRKADLLADVDFDSDTPLIELRVRLTMRIGRIFTEGTRFGVGVLWDLIRLKKEK